MDLIDRIIEMQQQGVTDSEIVSSLRNEGISPKEINDSLAQSKIKVAVNQPAQEEYQESYSEAPTEQQYVAPTENAPEYSGTEQYSDYQQPYYSNQASAETITDIVDRVATEKIRDVVQRFKEFSDFKLKTETGLADLKERVKRVEEIIDELQRGIIARVGEFAQTNSFIQKDLENLHTSFSKLANPLIDNYNEMKKTKK